MASDGSQTKLLDLPIDILYLIFPYLDVPEFVALTSTCKVLHQELSQYAPYWRTATRSTFRVPNQPVVENDGERWRKMYKRFTTQSKVYTWGNNDKGVLGHSTVTAATLNAAPPGLRMRMSRRSRHVSWPTEMANTHDIGNIADMQCGGWSTNLLTSKGAIYSVGVLDGLQSHTHITRPQQAYLAPQKLRYPPGFAHPTERYGSSTAVMQFSAGRAHILAISDSGRIWSWQNIDHAAYNVKFLNVEVKERAMNEEVGYVEKVVAGWNKSSALINGAGIVLWEPLAREHGAQESEEDAALVLETATVPLSGFRRTRVNARSSDVQGEHIGEVQSYIVLEQHVVFSTHLGKVFASNITWTREEQALSSPVEILLENGSFVNEGERSSFVTDVQGSFRSFSIFTRSGAVLIGNNQTLDDVFANPAQPSTLKRYPALQNNGVISLAFGDYHFHALHSDGHITSYGNELQGCGALGLGGHADPEGRLRGLRYRGIGADARLVPHAYTTGRRVWFEQEKQAWITFLTSGGADPEEASPRLRMCQETNVQGEVSEWVEQEGRAWEQKFGAKVSEDDDDGLGVYFAHCVTAAGWHSGALVLVNEERAEQTRKNCLASVPIKHEEPEDEQVKTEETGGVENLHIEEQQPDGRGLLDRAANQAAEWGRWALGLEPDTNAPAAAPVPRVSARHDPNNPHAFLHPENHGAATEGGRPYAWANDPFPRLRLSDGREMPGSVEISEWRFGRPEWDLNVQI